MKKLTILVFVVIVIGLVFFLRGGNGNGNNVDNTQITGNSFKPDPSNATFIFEQGPVTLSQGRYSAPLVPGSDIKEEIYITDIRGYGDINNDDKNDTVAVLVQSGGASGVFIYLAGYVSGPINYKGSNAVFLGDRITPRSIEVKNGLTTINYLDRKDDEPFAAEPTVAVSKTFIYRNGILEER